MLGTRLTHGSLADASCPFSCWCDLHSAWGAAQAVVASNLVPEQSPVRPDGAAGTASCAPGKRYGQFCLHGQGPMRFSSEAGFAHTFRAGFPLPSRLDMSPAPGCWCGKHRCQEETVAGLCHISARRRWTVLGTCTLGAWGLTGKAQGLSQSAKKCRGPGSWQH